jgi:hypothetical protein
MACLRKADTFQCIHPCCGICLLCRVLLCYSRVHQTVRSIQTTVESPRLTDDFRAIWITGILQIVFGIGIAVLYFVRHWYSAAIVFAIFSVFYIICFISWIPRIPFSVLMLQTVIDVSKNYGHVFIVSLVGGLIATAYAAWFSVTFVAVYAKYYPGNPGCDASRGSWSKAKVIGLLVFITFASYWISEVIKNVIHCTISGVYGSWYFCANKPGGFPKGATRGAFKRSMTYSFGSISFGSLIVAIIQFLRQA